MKPKGIVKSVLVSLVLAARFGLRNVNWKAAKMVTIYPSLNITYNRIKKNANTTATILLREMETGIVDIRGHARNKSFNFQTLPFRSILALRQHCFFVVVRNPYSRVLSAFLDKFRDDEYRQLYGSFDLTPEGFAAFVAWLQEGGLSKNAHWDLQTKFLLLPLDEYDVVVRFENFEEGMLSLLKSNGFVPPEDRLKGLYPSDANKKTSSDLRVKEFYTPELADIVARLYARDFEGIGYSQILPGC